MILNITIFCILFINILNGAIIWSKKINNIPSEFRSPKHLYKFMRIQIVDVMYGESQDSRKALEKYIERFIGNMTENHILQVSMQEFDLIKDQDIKDRFTREWRDLENLSMKMEIELSIPSKEEESFMRFQKKNSLLYSEYIFMIDPVIALYVKKRGSNDKEYFKAILRGGHVPMVVSLGKKTASPERVQVTKPRKASPERVQVRKPRKASPERDEVTKPKKIASSGTTKPKREVKDPSDWHRQLSDLDSEKSSTIHDMKDFSQYNEFSDFIKWKFKKVRFTLEKRYSDLADNAVSDFLFTEIKDDNYADSEQNSISLITLDPRSSENIKVVINESASKDFYKNLTSSTNKSIRCFFNIQTTRQYDISSTVTDFIVHLELKVSFIVQHNSQAIEVAYQTLTHNEYYKIPNDTASSLRSTKFLPRNIGLELHREVQRDQSHRSRDNSHRNSGKTDESKVYHDSPTQSPKFPSRLMKSPFVTKSKAREPYHRPPPVPPQDDLSHPKNPPSSSPIDKTKRLDLSINKNYRLDISLKGEFHSMEIKYDFQENHFDSSDAFKRDAMEDITMEMSNHLQSGGDLLNALNNKLSTIVDWESPMFLSSYLNNSSLELFEYNDDAKYLRSKKYQKNMKVICTLADHHIDGVDKNMLTIRVESHIYIISNKTVGDPWHVSKIDMLFKWKKKKTSKEKELEYGKWTPILNIRGSLNNLEEVFNEI